MLTKIDWLSFTVPMEVYENATILTTAGEFRWQLYNLNPSLPETLGLFREIVPQAGRKPYSFGYRVEGEFITIYASKTLPHALIEISGQGCAKLEEKALLMEVLTAAAPRLTRLDVASDFLTELRPSEFVAAGYTSRIQSHGEIISRDGETEYVGSRTSDRFCRVYRYNAPHERAHLMRIEYQLKRENARQAAALIQTEGIFNVGLRLGNSFEWKHLLWTLPLDNGDKMPSWKPDRHDAKTMFWLNAQVAPSLIKAHRTGVLNAQAWFDENVKPKLSNDLT